MNFEFTGKKTPKKPFSIDKCINNNIRSQNLLFSNINLNKIKTSPQIYRNQQLECNDNRECIKQ